MQISHNSYLEERLNVFQYLFNTYYQPLVAYAYKIVNDHQEAEDIIQDVFLSLWINKDTFNYDQPIKPYLFKAVYNRSINYLKARKPSIDITASDAGQLLSDEIISSHQEESLLLKETSEQIKNFIETLPAQCKKIFKLSRISGLKNKEIAKTLNISKKTVESHISKALKDLRTHLKAIGIMSLFLFSLFRIFIG
ncbi:MAG: RNA polymerase sigma-70 factor [Tannerella sp.]|jgi:RNA polymerase sigma-70 factor (ECF subfamily)|nr:RNA polymerase sigma-70 factor [Tannerella sp.]